MNRSLKVFQVANDKIEKGSMLNLESQGLGSIPIMGKYHFLFYIPNLHNIARSGGIRFKMKNSIVFS